MVVVPPRDRVDFHRLADTVTVHDLAVGAVMAETPAELARVELLALVKLGPRRIHTEPAVLPTRGRPSRPLWQWVDRARTRLDIHDMSVAVLAAQREENRIVARIVDGQRRRDVREARAHEQRRNGRYVPSFLT